MVIINNIDPIPVPKVTQEDEQDLSIDFRNVPAHIARLIMM